MLGLIAAACGGDDDDDAGSTAGTDTAPSAGADTEPSAGTDTEPTAGTDTAPTTAGEDTSTTGDGGAESEGDPDAILRVGQNFVSGIGISVDPARYIGQSATCSFQNLVYDTMIHETPDGGIEPGLATEWEFPDEQTIDLTLREGVTFHDGTEFDADAVKYNWDRVIAATPEQFTRTSATAALESVEVLEPYKVRVNLNAPLAADYRDRYLKEACSALGVVSPAALEASGGEINVGDVPVGAGPFTWENYVPDQRVELRRYEDYWAPKLLQGRGGRLRPAVARAAHADGAGQRHR